jgi:hypothetical protein
MKKIKFSFIWAGVAVFILWLISIFIPITPLAIALFLVIAVIAGAYGGTVHPKPVPEVFGVEATATASGKGKGWTFSWTWQDWGGLILLILVVAALVKGVNPIDIMKALGSFFGSSQGS